MGRNNGILHVRATQVLQALVDAFEGVAGDTTCSYNNRMELTMLFTRKTRWKPEL